LRCSQTINTFASHFSFVIAIPIIVVVAMSAASSAFNAQSIAKRILAVYLVVQLCIAIQSRLVSTALYSVLTLCGVLFNVVKHVDTVECFVVLW
jgi:hypothetical protein